MAATFVVSILSLIVSVFLCTTLLLFQKEQSQFNEKFATSKDSQPTTGTEQHSIPPDELRNEFEELRKILTGITNIISETKQAQVRDMPPSLKQFLDEVQKPDILMSKNTLELDTLRGELVDVINQMSGSRRDELREEIALANWTLEALELTANATADSVEARMTDFVLLKGLVDASPTQAPHHLKLAMSDLFEKLKMSLVSDLNTVVESLRHSGLEVPETEFSRGALIYELLVDANTAVAESNGEACRVFLAMHDWMKKAKEAPIHAGPNDNSDLAARRALILCQEGELLRDQLFKLGFSESTEFNQAIQAVSSGAEDLLEKKQKALSSAYQLWAIEQIELAREFGVGDVKERVQTFLSESKSNPSAAATNSSHLTMLREFPSFREKLGQLAGIPTLNASEPPSVDASMHEKIAKELYQLVGWKGDEELARCLVSDAISQHLLLIDESFLDRPVASLYSEVFEKCWNHDYALPNRVQLAKAAATGSKMKPQQLAELQQANQKK